MLVKFVLVSMLICFAPPLVLRDCKHWSALCQTQGDFLGSSSSPLPVCCSYAVYCSGQCGLGTTAVPVHLEALTSAISCTGSTEEATTIIRETGSITKKLGQSQRNWVNHSELLFICGCLHAEIMSHHSRH